MRSIDLGLSATCLCHWEPENADADVACEAEMPLLSFVYRRTYRSYLCDKEGFRNEQDKHAGESLPANVSFIVSHFFAEEVDF